MAQKSHNYITIIENNRGYIGYCKCCQTVSVCYQNSLFCFQLPEYQWFCKLIEERKYMTEYNTSHGKEVLMKTPMNNYYILFKQSELDEFSEMLQQATFLVDTFKNAKNLN